ncbi:MAG TPA: hypothetical protein VFU80_03080 [Sphingomicrobium sp.]|nr:hypothetical protein [Sphingomicrobium sp.]
MRFAILAAGLLLAACDNAKDWENEQAELANELNATEPAPDPNSMSDTDYINEAAAANDMNAAAPAANDVNVVSENAPAATPEG